MKILIIVAHPNKDSFNHAIFYKSIERIKRNGHTAIEHDLYSEGFDPILTCEEIPKSGEITKEIKKHCDDLITADGIIIIHPNWWGQPPAILKGWIDRVLRPGLTYEFVGNDLGEGVPVGLLKAKAALIFNTSNTNKTREEEIFKDPLEAIWKNCIFDLCGVGNFYRKMYRILVTTPELRKAWLDEIDKTVDSYFPSEI